MSRIPAFLFLLGSVAVSAAAQDTLSGLERRFRDEAQQLAASSPSPEQRQQQLERHAAELRAFVAERARGDDRWNGRLMLADLELARGDAKGAADALRGIDAAAAPAMVLITAATMAQHLGMQEQREAWTAAAIDKPAPLADRLAMARLLMTVLHEIDKGERLFAGAIEQAADDEQRAYVRYCRADALRDREDLPDNAGFDELDKLAKDLPSTYWGGIAKDRLRATQLAIGDPAIDFRAATLNGEPASLLAQRGKLVVLAFWTQADFDTPGLVDQLEQLLRTYPSQVVVYGICLDRNADEIKKAVAELGIDFPVIGDGKGPQTDAALRWFVEGPTVHVVDRDGKVAGLGLQTGTADGRAQLTEIVARALRG